MPDIELVKTGAGDVRGYGQENDRAYKRYKAWVNRLGPGEFFSFSYRHPRNVAMHKKFFALVTYVAENSDIYNNKDKALLAIKISAGHCDFVPAPRGGGLLAVPKSVSFAELDQGAFEVFYEGAVQGVIDHILPYMNRVSLDEALRTVAAY